MLNSRLVILSGLPGSGKSKIAEAIGRQLAIPVFAKDWLESTLLRSGFDAQTHPVGYAAYELLTTLAERQLALGQSAILDSVASVPQLRQQWYTLAQGYGAAFYVIECICSDEALHRARLETRQRHIPDWPELTWAEVERVQAYYPTWDIDRLVLDAAESFEVNLAQAIQYVST